MRALWLESRSLRLREALPVPEPPPGEARIRVLRAGICNTDLELVKGYYPFAGVPGHEFVGQVEAAPGHDAWVGRRVVGEINAACRACETCRAGRPSHCPGRTVLGIVGRDGAFAEFLTLPVANLHAVPDGLGDEHAVFVEPTAAALEIQEQVALGPDQRAAVVGAGKLGLLVAQTLALTGCRLQVVARGRRGRDLLEARGIATAGAAELPAGGFDVAVECTGNPEGLALARRLVRPRGTIVLKSTYHGETRLDVAAIVVDEITLVGSRCGPFRPAVELLAAGRIEVAALIDERYPLADAVEAFSRAAQAGTLKVLVDPTA